jgi:signal transduction histidine kinase
MIPPLRSVGNKLALVFFAITAAAFSVIYFLVVPQLQSNLENQKITDLRRSALAARPTLEGLMGRPDVSAQVLDSRVRAVADSTGARVTLVGVQQSTVPGNQRFFVISDSREERAVPLNEALATRAVSSGALQTGRTTLAGEALGQVAQPLVYQGHPDWVAIYSASFQDVAETVSFMRERVLAASGAALLIALLGSYLVARALSRRVRRLEQGAREMAEGSFVDPLPVTSQDELGQLTVAFNEMQRRLRQVDVARKEFIATASHELRTPIFSLGGFVELLRDEDLDEATRAEFLETMSEQVARLQKLSVDLLDLSRLDAGTMELHREPVDLAELARSVAGEFRPALADHHTELDVQLPEAGVAARCDPERVAQIVRILLDNALRHTPDGTEVVVSAGAQNGAAELIVSDTGPGMSDGSRTHVFERFYTGDATRGAGLGLAIAKELAERMEGRIELATRPGRTAFTLTLPGAAAPDGDG